jgi:hypothetical protein
MARPRCRPHPPAIPRAEAEPALRGINGVLRHLEGVPDPALVRRQSRALRHRGPDDAGARCEVPAALGPRRPAIVDPGPACHPPTPNGDRSVGITHDGELDGRRLASESELESPMPEPSVPRDVDPPSVAGSLVFRYVPGPRCPFRGVRRRPPRERPA